VISAVLVPGEGESGERGPWRRAYIFEQLQAALIVQQHGWELARGRVVVPHVEDVILQVDLESYATDVDDVVVWRRDELVRVRLGPGKRTAVQSLLGSGHGCRRHVECEVVGQGWRSTGKKGGGTRARG
jgi:hypothetical protein